MVLRYSPGFYPFSNPSPGTHLGPSLVLAQISIFLILTRIPHFRYSPGSPISGTLPDPTFSVLTRISHSQYSPGSHIFGTRPDHPFPVLSRILPFSVLTRILPSPILARIPPFPVITGIFPSRYSPGFHILSTRPDPTFSVLARITHFRYYPGSYLFRYSPGFYLLQYSPGYYLF